jgi:hypothetical protein
MDIRYFFIKDRVESKEIHIAHCPTDQMIADYFTKPLQGHLFRRMRDYIMNIDPSDKYHSGHRSVLSVNNGGAVEMDHGSTNENSNAVTDCFDAAEGNGSHSWSFTKD